METAPLTYQISADNAAQVLFVLLRANFQSVADQAFKRNGNFSKYRIVDMIASQRTGAASVACVGGIYDAASKSGNAIVSAAQNWVTLAAGVTVAPTLSALVSTTLLSATPILSLTTGSTAVITADIYIMGYPID